MSRRIILVDDDGDFCAETASFLSENDYNVEVCSDGFRALREIKRSRPDCVLIDFSMTGLSGIQLTALMRLSDETRDIPVILLVTEPVNQETVEAGQICCVNKWLVKPLDLPGLPSVIESLLPATESFPDEVQVLISDGMRPQKQSQLH